MVIEADNERFAALLGRYQPSDMASDRDLDSAVIRAAAGAVCEKRNDPTRNERAFLQAAIHQGLLTPESARECLKTQADGLQRGEERSVEELLLEKRILTATQAEALWDRVFGRSKVGERLGGYELVERIGQGGMGTVYRARQIKTDREVAVKVLARHFSRSAAFVERFQREAKAAAQIVDPHIVTVLDAGCDRGCHYFAMRYVRGRNLAQILERHGPLSEHETVAIAVGVAEGLEAIHQVGMVHRDIKPSNIMITDEGVVKIADFGLVKNVAGEFRDITGAGVAVGTPQYNSPEQAGGTEEVDIRSDIYGLGATLFHLATGKPPFAPEALGGLRSEDVHDVPDPRALRPRLSMGFSLAVKRMMATAPESRFQDPRELLNDLNDLAKRLETTKAKGVGMSTSAELQALEKLGRLPGAEADQEEWGEPTRKEWLLAMMSDTPWWVTSIALHALILLILSYIVVSNFEKVDDTVVLQTAVKKKEEQKYDEKLDRSVEKIEKDIPLENIVQDPVFTTEQVQVSDHMESENNMDLHTAQGAEENISDIPLGGTGVVGAIGLGGGGGGAYGQRGGGGRQRLVKAGGGSKATESAVNAALEWLARNQEPDGHWDIKKHGSKLCSSDADTGVSGLAVLAFLGAGNTHKAGKYKDNVQRGLKWLISKQAADGSIGLQQWQVAGGHAGGGYNHALGGIALAEAFAMSRDRALRDPAQKAVDYSLQHQVEYSGWRYEKKMAPDISVTGWFIMQMKSAKVAGLAVDGTAFQGGLNWIEEMTIKDAVKQDPNASHASAGQVGRCNYVKGNGPWPSCTAIGFLARLFCGSKRSDPLCVGGAEYLLTELPTYADRPRGNHCAWPFYYAYYGSLAMFQMGGTYWKQWNTSMVQMMVPNQSKGGADDGSWTGFGEEWNFGGRVYTTALGALCLEVYYRYLPMAK